MFDIGATPDATPPCAGPNGRSPVRPPTLADGEAKTRLMSAAIRLGADPNRLSATSDDLAEAAGFPVELVERYAPGADPMATLACELMAASLQRMCDALRPIVDPAERLATSIRLYVRRAQDNPGRTTFILRYGANSTRLSRLMAEPTECCIREGLQLGQFNILESQVPATTAMVNGLAISAANLVARQLDDWERTGSFAARLALTGLGFLQSDAKRVSRLRLPVVPPILLGDNVPVAEGLGRAGSPPRPEPS